MAYKKSSSCGGLRYSTTDFTEVDGVLTAAGNSELVGDPFLASMCGGIWFDDGVFGEVGRVITTVDTTVVENSFPSNCCLLFDKDRFEIGEDKEIALVAPYLCFTAQEANSTISMTNSDGCAPEVSLETSSNGMNWTPFVVGDTTITLANIGDKVYFRGDNESMAEWNEEINEICSNSFNMTGKIAASGNIMSLLDKTCESVTIDSEYCFGYMFQGCTSLTTAPELPATTLAVECYDSMFYNCTSLTTPPKLPATTLTDYCYYSMFMDCTSLTTAPELPATTLAVECYDSMFYNCTSLTTPPQLLATTLAHACYQAMFSGCTSLTTAPQLPATTLTEGCYSDMFTDCTSLYVSDTSGVGYDKAWNIPTTGIAIGDYTMTTMFYDCLGTRSTNSPNFNGVQKTYYTQNAPV